MTFMRSPLPLQCDHSVIPSGCDEMMLGDVAEKKGIVGRGGSAGIITGRRIMPMTSAAEGDSRC